MLFNAYTYLLTVIVKRIVSRVPNSLKMCVHALIYVYAHCNIRTQNFFSNLVTGKGEQYVSCG